MSRLAPLALVLIALASPGPAVADFLYDQSDNLFAPPNSSVTGTDLGQSFVPTATSIAGGFFTLTSAPTTPETFVITLRSGAGLGGSFIMSTTVYDPSFAYIQYNFPFPISVTPGATYTVEIALTSGAEFTLYAFNNNQYVAGSAYNRAGPIAGYDLLFAEGPPNVIPEPASLTMVGLGLAGVGAYSRRRRPA